MGKEKGQKQHFVPEFFLKNWTDSDETVGVFRIDVPKLHFSRRSPGGAGYEHGLYSLKGVKETETNLVEEKVFGPIDNYAAPVIRRLLEFASPRLSGEEFEWLTIFAASLEMRNPKNIGEMKDMMDSELKDDPHLGDEVYRKLLESNSEIVTNETLQNLGVFIVNTARTFRTELKYWRVEDFTGGRKHLLLSDFPCIRTNGVGYPDVVFALPLSPWKALLGFKTLETQQFHLGNTSRGVLVSRINESSLNQTTSYIYALDDEPRRFLEKRLRSEVPS